MAGRRRGVRAELAAFAGSLPEAYEDHPWGDGLVMKVNKKIFVFLGVDAPPVADPARGAGTGAAPSFAVKLREAHEQAMAIPGAVPTAYGLGRSGWVSVPLAGEIPDVGTLCDFVEESYRIVAPRRLVAVLDGRSEGSRS